MNHREVAIKLVAQAVDPAVTHEEARSFAMKAVQFIAEHKLLAPTSSSPGVGGPSAPGFGFGGAFDSLLGNLSTIALGASAIEIVSLQAEAQRLRRENAELRSQIRMSKPSFKKKRRRV